MNQKTSKLIKRKITSTHGLSPTIIVDGKEQRNVQYRKIVNMVKKEYLATPRNKRAQFKVDGI